MKRTTSSTKAPAPTLNPSLRATPLTLAWELFDELDQEWTLIPSTHRTQWDLDRQALIGACLDLRISDVATLLERQNRALSTLTGLRSPTAYQRATDADPLHRYRNMIVAVAVAAAPHFDPTAVLASTRSTLRSRTGKAHRPLTDDEITLLRTVIAVIETASPGNQRAAIYAQCDAGMLVAETTMSRAADVIGDADAPTAILADGNRITDSRILPLDAFHRRALAHAITTAASTGPTSLLSYRPRKNQPGSDAAAASANAVLGHLLLETGLAQLDTAPSSLTRWRIAHTLITQDLDAAVELSGRSLAATIQLADPAPDIEQITERAKENFMLLPAVA